MPDSKITALTALTGADPANDMFPLVDVSDTTMAASGTTKRISINNILACSPTATLASLNVTGSSIPANGLYLPTTNTLEFAANSLAQYRIAPLGVFSWYDGAGGTRMTLNSTGLGVGVASPTYNIDVLGATLPTIAVRATSAGASNARVYLECAGTNGGNITYNRSLQALQLGANGATSAQVTLDSLGNVGVGVTPSAWGVSWKGLEVSSVLGLMGGSATSILTHNMYANAAAQLIYKTTNFASYYQQQNGIHSWLTAPSGTAGNVATFTQTMTLDASGNLLVGATTNTNSSRVFARGTGGATTLAIQSSTGDTANPALLVGKFDNDSTTSQILVRFTINNNAAGSGQITANGANAAAFGTFSDSRLKENIASIPSQLEKIVSLRPVEFDFKNGSGHQIGFVAQEMQEVYPDVVGEQDGFLTVTGWSKTEARLVSAIKELAAKVQALETKLA